MLKYYVLFIPLLGFSLITGMQPKTQKNQFKGWREFAKKAYWGDEETAQKNENVTLRKNTLRRQVAPSPKTTSDISAPFLQAPAVTVVIQETPQNVTTRKTSSPKKQQRTHTHSRTPMKLSAKKQLPAHLAAYFGYCVNGGHYEEAMELLPALRSYGPAIMLHTITKHPSKGDAVLKDWQLPKNINEKQFRRTAFFELKRKAALKKAQQNNE